MKGTRRFLKKVGTEMVFGFTEALAAKKEMIECDAKGLIIATVSNVKKSTGLLPLDSFNLGMSFMMAGEKTLRVWIEEHLLEINMAGIEIQGKLIEKWQKHFGSEPMPDGCMFVVEGNPGDK